MGVRISVFAPYLCNTSASGLDVYAGGCLFEKGADWHPFCLGGGVGALEGGVGGGGASGVPTPKSIRAIKNTLLVSARKLQLSKNLVAPPPPHSCTLPITAP